MVCSLLIGAEDMVCALIPPPDFCWSGSKGGSTTNGKYYILKGQIMSYRCIIHTFQGYYFPFTSLSCLNSLCMPLSFHNDGDGAAT